MSDEKKHEKMAVLAKCIRIIGELPAQEQVRVMAALNAMFEVK